MSSYCSLGFDQRQEKARKPRVRQLGGRHLGRRNGVGWGWGWTGGGVEVGEEGEEEEKKGKGRVPIGQSGQCVKKR